MTRVLLVCHDIANNAIGRAWSLSLVLDHLGWDWDVLAGASGAPWPPLRDEPFLERCRVVARVLRPRDVGQAVDRTDLIVAVKAIPGSLGVVLRARTGVPVLADIDDDDLGEWRGSVTPRQRLGLIRPSHWWHRSTPRDLDRLDRQVRTLTRTVSNPELQTRYGGELVPHVRKSTPPPARTDRRPPVVGFIGSVKPHKGLEVLRSAAAAMPGGAWPLVVTAPRPPDARPNEQWIGQTTLSELPQTMARIDLMAVLSHETPFALAQAPVKIIDAMLATRAVIASDLPVLHWMTGGNAVHVDPRSVDAVMDGLGRLADPGERQALVDSALLHARELFTPEAVAPLLAAAARRARK